MNNICQRCAANLRGVNLLGIFSNIKKKRKQNEFGDSQIKMLYPFAKKDKFYVLFFFSSLQYEFYTFNNTRGFCCSFFVLFFSGFLLLLLFVLRYFSFCFENFFGFFFFVLFFFFGFAFGSIYLYSKYFCFFFLTLFIDNFYF